MANKSAHSFNVININDDPTYENWLALYACIMNHRLSVGDALRIMGLTTEKNLMHRKGGTGHDS
ncbi:MAG: hypothetical protein ACOYJ1_13060 [Peptococcales bacterium]|jgi:hypothetical protein